MNKGITPVHGGTTLTVIHIANKLLLARVMNGINIAGLVFGSNGVVLLITIA